MQKKVYMADYICDSTVDGMPVGHPMKVLKEFSPLFDGKAEICILASGETIGLQKKYIGHKLPAYAIRNKGGMIQVIKNYFGEWKNLREIWKIAKDGLIWFYNTDYLLFLFLLFAPKKDRKIVCSTYVSIPENTGKWTKALKKFLVEKGSVKMDQIFYSNPEFRCNHGRKLFVPDYLYYPERYIYSSGEKQEMAVCLGTMAKDNKELLESVRVFTQLNYPLLIAGKFYERSYYDELCQIKGSNITIRDEYLDYEEYMSLLCKARYSLLPYRREAYGHKTSGVILESAFAGAVPISSQSILYRLEIPGVAYKELNDLLNMDLRSYHTEGILEMQKELNRERYDAKRKKKEIYEKLQDL